MINLAPIAVTGAALIVKVPSGVSASAGTDLPIRVSNESPYQATVSVAGISVPIDPFTADLVVPPQKVTSLTVSFSQLTTPLPSSPVSQLVVSFAEQGEDFPGVYPMPLGRLTAAAGAGGALLTNLGIGSITATGSFQVPTGTLALSIIMIPGNGAGGPTNFALTGHQTGFAYFNEKPTAQQRYLRYVDSVADTQIDWGSTNLQATQGANVWVTALGSAAAVEAFSDPSAALQPLSQGPTSIVDVEVSAGGVTPVVAAVAGQRVRVFGWQLSLENGGAGTNIVFLEDTTGGAGHRIATGAASSTTPLEVTGNHGGAPLPLGLGLQLNVAAFGAGGNVRAHVGVNQG